MAKEKTIKIRVLKPFRFSQPANVGTKLPVEHSFDVGDNWIDEDVASHPWIAEDFADGHIESPEQAVARTQAAKVKADADAAAAENANAEAEMALRRLNLSQPVAERQSKLSAADLNTPVNVLRQRAGRGIDGTDEGAEEDSGTVGQSGKEAEVKDEGKDADATKDEAKDTAKDEAKTDDKKSGKRK